MSDTPSAYEHSSTFASLKGLTETLQGNHTSAQYLETLDTLIDNALRPIIQSTSLFEGFVGQLIGWQEANRKRKVSFLDRHEFTSLACAWMLIPSKIDKSFQARRLRIERGALLEFLNTFLESSERYMLACSARLTDPAGRILPLDEQLAYRRAVEEAYGSPVLMRPYLMEANYWWRRAQEFKNLILEKYVRLCLVAAQTDYRHTFKCKVKLDDIIQSYLLAAIRAIDKCDARQGVLTTHIRNWFLTARAGLVSAMREELAEIADDGEHPEELHGSVDPVDLDVAARIESVRFVARLADPEGYGRAYLGISESLTYIEDNTNVPELVC